MDCVFCKIIEKEIPAQTVFEDKENLAILDIHPSAPGHTILFPKTHKEFIVELTEEEIASLFISVKKVCKKIEEKISPDGFTIGINHGKVSGQEIPHVHVHIIPRWKNDGGGSIPGIIKNNLKGSLDEIQNKLST